MSFVGMMLIGVVLDLLIGWPDALFRRIGHPVTWVGRAISWGETWLNHGGPGRRILTGGFLTLGLCISVGLITALPLSVGGVAATLIGGVLAWPLIAVRSMHEHVMAVARPLRTGDVAGARHAVSMIVGRDPRSLDEAGIARASLESLAENTSDGIIAPVFWGCVAGLPGLAVYKVVNTLDSMIGHRSDRYEAFGKIAARLDDLVNYIPARLTGVLFALASGQRVLGALRVMWRDARHHRSVNAGWPEGAMAGGLAVRLSGPRQYEGRQSDEPWVNAEAPDPTAQSVFDGLALYRRVIVLVGLVLCGLLLL